MISSYVLYLRITYGVDLLRKFYDSRFFVWRYEYVFEMDVEAFEGIYKYHHKKLLTHFLSKNMYFCSEVCYAKNELFL